MCPALGNFDDCFEAERELLKRICQFGKIKFNQENATLNELQEHIGKPLFIHIDEIGGLSRDEIYTLWSVINDAMRNPKIFIFGSGKGYNIPTMGFSANQSPGLMRHLLLDPLEPEHIRQILCSPIVGEDEPICQKYFNIPVERKQNMEKCSEMIARLSAGIPRVMLFGLRGLHLRKVPIDQIEQWPAEHIEMLEHKLIQLVYFISLCFTYYYYYYLFV